MPLVCDGHVMLAQDRTYDPWETAQLCGPPNKMGQQLETRIAFVGCGKLRKRTDVCGRMIKHIVCSEHWPHRLATLPI
jgi:hypothetical protein